MRVCFSALCASVLALLMSSMPALATVRHVTTTGSGLACTAATPCALAAAIKVLQTGDEISIAPGAYEAGTGLAPDGAPQSTYVHGIEGQPAPTITGAPASPLGLLQTGPLTRMRHLRFIARSGLWSPLVITGQTDDVLAMTNNTREAMVIKLGTTAAAPQSYSVSGLAAITSGSSNAISVQGHGNLVLAGSTLVASAPGTYGLVAYASAQVTAYATIFRQLGASGGDVGAVGDPAYAVQPKVTLRGSALRAERVGRFAGGDVVVDGTNVFAAPLLTDPFSGDPQQLPYSPTIDAGISPGGALYALGGGLRLSGPLDIGATEFLRAPLASTGAATPRPGPPSDGVLVDGVVDTGGIASGLSAFVEYGPTAAYGARVHAADIASRQAAPTAVAAVIPTATLPVGAQYHYRVLVASAAQGSGAGEDRVFVVPPRASSPSPFSFATLTRLRVASVRPRRDGKVVPVLRLTTSRAVALGVRLERVRPGRRRGARCVARGTGRRCTRYVPTGRAMTLKTLRAGAVALRLPARRLPRGRYRLTVFSQDGRAAAPRRVVFSVLRRR